MHMGQKEISFSIVIPVMEDLAYLLPFTLSSLASQKEVEGTKIEVILIDGTKQGICLGLDTHQKLEIFRSSLSNRYALMNEGILKSKGDYIHFLMPGEYYISSRVFEHVQKFLKEYAEPDLAYGGCFIRHSFGQPSVFLKKISQEDLQAVSLPSSLQSFWFRKETLCLIGMFSKKFEMEGGVELIYRLFKAPTLTKAFIPRILTDYEYRAPSSKRVLRQFFETFCIVLAHVGISYSLFQWIGRNYLRLVKWGWKMVKIAFWKPYVAH